MNLNQIIEGDALSVLKTMPAKLVQCVVTSPPYWGLRDYGEAGQLGLESTPEEYVAKMVEIFAEVRRVLRDDGTLWLNMGDSYAAGGRGGGFPESTDGRDNLKPAKPPPGLKPKDLCGIPWAVAKALQQPYYTGKIKREQDRVWLAAIIDGEGCMFIHKRGVGQYTDTYKGKKYYRKNATYGAGLEVSNTHREIVERCMAITGIGSICKQSPETNKRRKQTIYRWNVRSNECRWIVHEIYPDLIGKQHEARLLLGCPSSGKDAVKAHASLIALHNGNEAIIDFPEPESMYEPGWYLRSDIVWSKKNPMPESITDRPTKSHEYMFLLTKSGSSQYWTHRDKRGTRKQPGPDYRWTDEITKEETTIKPEGWTIKNKMGWSRLNLWQGRDYYYDADAVREESRDLTGRAQYGESGNTGNYKSNKDKMVAPQVHHEYRYSPKGRNCRTVWEIATQPYAKAHFATFPEKLVEPCILAGSNDRACGICGAAWERVTDYEANYGKREPAHAANNEPSKVDSSEWDWPQRKFLGFRPSCQHDNGDSRSIILDPFMGSGTVALIALKLGRDYVGIELKLDYIEMAMQRLKPLGNRPCPQQETLL